MASNSLSSKKEVHNFSKLNEIVSIPDLLSIQVSSMEEYKKIMDDLKLENPKMMDIAVSANKKGLTLDQVKS